MAPTPTAAQILSSLQTVLGGPTELDEPRPLEQIILLILASELDVRKARTAMKRLQAEYVDWNEVRVTSTYELSTLLKPLGAKKAEQKAQQVKDLLTTIYNRYNKLNLDFLRRETRGAEEGRRRERFFAQLQEQSLSLHAMMTLHGADRTEVVVQPPLIRVMQRLGLIPVRSATAAAARKKLTDAFASDLISVQWCFYFLAERWCHSRNPDCPSCPAAPQCPVGQKELKKVAAASKVRAKAESGKAKATKKKPTVRRR